MRKPKKPMPDWDPVEQPDLITQIHSYKLITPLYGGGVKAGEVDEHTPVRGTAIRGHLRFWWRAMRGGQFGKLTKMKEKEDEMWGSASTPSQVSLAINHPHQSSKEGTKFQAVDKNNHPQPIGDPRSTTGYATFPLRDKDQDILEGIAFDLKITFPENIRKEIEAALWAWTHFGGIGARTRRGFGALDCTQVEENGTAMPLTQFTTANAKEKILVDFKFHFEGADFPDNVPHLAPNLKPRLKIKSFSESGKATNVWINLIQAMQDFRQARPQNKVQEGGRSFTRPGRNKWPEPDAIRDKVNPRNRKYPETLYPGGINKAPRAAFGLPIIFKFKGEGTMPKVTLKGEKHDRFASPLIIRPLACQDEKYVGLALVLEGTDVTDLPSKLILEGVRRNREIDSELTDPEAAKIAAKHNNYDGNTDILQAFLDSL